MDGWWRGKRKRIRKSDGGKNFGQHEKEKSREADGKDLGRI
jgi:hypothetical protein